MNGFGFDLSKSLHALSILVTLGTTVLHAQVGQADAQFASTSSSPIRTSSTERLAFAFVPNAGQWPTDARFVVSGRNLVVRAEQSGVWIEGLTQGGREGTLDRAVFHLTFETSGKGAELRAESPLPGTRNYFYGRDPDRWRTGLVPCASLVWAGVRPGVDFVLERGRAGTPLEYSLHCTPGTGERPLAMRLEGADEVSIDSQGWLVARTSIGELRQSPPRAWQIDPVGAKHSTAARFALLGKNRFTIEVPGRDDSMALLVDPGLDWAGYIGGDSTDLATDMALSATDEPVIAGRTLSFDFPTTPGVFQPTDPPGYDVFAMKVSADGTSVVFASYVGGGDVDQGWGVAVRPSGRVIVGGMTRSPDFPVTPGAFDTQFDSEEGVLLELRSDGTALVYSTFVGGSGKEVIKAIALSSNGEITLAGDTTSTDFPGTSLGAQPGYGGGQFDAFVATVATDGASLLGASYLGGTGDEYITDVAMHQDGSAIVVGWSRAGGFPVTPGAFDTTYSPTSLQEYSGVVARFQPSLSSLDFASYLDASDGSRIWKASTMLSGEVVVVGVATSSDFPTTGGAFDTTFDAGTNGFVSVLTADGSALTYSTFDGSIGSSAARALHVDETGVITIGGQANGDPFPTTPGAFDNSVGTLANPDAYVMRFKPDGSAPLYATLMGAVGGWEESFVIALDSHGRAIVLGNVLSDSFPTTPGSFDPTYGGGPSTGYDEGFLARLEMQPLGVTAFGTPTPACQGPVRLTALHVPKAGNSAFKLACTGAPPNAFGILGVSAMSQPSGIPLLGATVYLDFAAPILLFPILADVLGYCELALPIPLSATGIQVFAQAGWIDTGGCGGSLAVSASDALQIDISNP